jgi:hypothetical protein
VVAPPEILRHLQSERLVRHLFLLVGAMHAPAGLTSGTHSMSLPVQRVQRVAPINGYVPFIGIGSSTGPREDNQHTAHGVCLLHRNARIGHRGRAHAQDRQMPHMFAGCAWIVTIALGATIAMWLVALCVGTTGNRS